jgi:hypothetical protein
MIRTFRVLVFWLACFIPSARHCLQCEEWKVDPQVMELCGHFATAQVLISIPVAAEHDLIRNADRTALATFTIDDPEIARVDEHGNVRALANGSTYLHIVLDEQSRRIPVRVDGIGARPVVDFVQDVQPVLYRAGCNSGACHASQYGKGGFTLSVMGFDPSLDHASITTQTRGRRVSFANPKESLILRKATMAIPHGGGVRITPESNEFAILKAWIENGCSKPNASAAAISGLRVYPNHVAFTPGHKQQFRVVAQYADGTTRDVTSLARFDSMDESVASISANGTATAVGKGQGTVLARFSGQAALATLVVPFSNGSNLVDWKPLNYVDEHAALKFQELGLNPSGLCDDSTFLRRAYLDAIGSLPSPEQTRSFLESSDEHKRQRLIDSLLGFSDDALAAQHREAYAAYWSLKWADLIRNNSAVVGESGMWAFHNWLKESFRINKSMDVFVTELITAKGSIFSNGPANYYRIANNPSDLAESTAQLFLGTRLQCAKCHHHPYERYSQSDYYGFAAHFARVGTKGSSEFGIFGGETIVLVRSGGEVNHPKSGAVMKPTPLFATPVDDPHDRRVPLAKWLTSRENELFARNLVNRYMAYLLGRGLVDPIDDLRSTNPPSNVGLMNALAADFQEHGFNVKHLMRTMMSSRLYQLASQPTAENVSDARFYSHYRVKRLSAEVLLDCIDHVTGVPTKHPNLPLGTRAIELPDANTTNPFLVVFGKPKRTSVCECERSPDENLAQALHTLNGDVLATKLADANGRVGKLVAESLSNEEKIRSLYVTTLCRFPTSQELDAALAMIANSPSPTEAYQDLLWALINSKQFLFVR